MSEFAHGFLLDDEQDTPVDYASLCFIVTY